MIDGCGREIDHLRLSLIDHCNLACRYCVPGHEAWHGTMIDERFAVAVVRWLSDRHGIRHVRLTGGEPLLYPRLEALIESIAAMENVIELTLTTNGQSLETRAAALRRAGLTRINVSLDTLDPARFEEMTRGGRLDRTLAGIEAAVDAGLTPVRINAVAMRGSNDREFADLAEWGVSRGCVVRFLEVMPIGPIGHVADKHLVPAAEVIASLERRFTLRPIPQTLGQPAVDYAIEGAGVRGVVGVIAPTTRPFCDRCRRMRVTARGEIVACLHDDNRANLIQWWDGERLDERGADQTLHKAVMQKPAVGPKGQTLTMLQIGG